MQTSVDEFSKNDIYKLLNYTPEISVLNAHPVGKMSVKVAPNEASNSLAPLLIFPPGHFSNFPENRSPSSEKKASQRSPET